LEKAQTGLVVTPSICSERLEPPLAQHCPANSKNEQRRGTTMVDRSGLRLVGFIFASVTFAVMLTTTMVVKGYSDGVYSLESAAIEGR
jgi:hypothetical protein